MNRLVTQLITYLSIQVSDVLCYKPIPIINTIVCTRSLMSTLQTRKITLYIHMPMLIFTHMQLYVKGNHKLKAASKQTCESKHKD